MTSVGITDTAASVVTSLDNLQANAAKITGISLTDAPTPTLAISAATLTNDSNALGLIGSNYKLSVNGVGAANVANVLKNTHVATLSITDSAANITANLDSLQVNVTKITGISLTDFTTPTLAITATTLANDGTALGLLGGNYNLTVGGVSSANVASVLSN